MSSQVIITIRLTGTCPTGHPVASDMTASVKRGSRGVATSNVTCPVPASR